MPYQDVDLNFRLPHKLFSGLHRVLHDSFVSSALGGSAGNIARFWSCSCQSCPHCPSWDGVNDMQRMAGSKSLEVLSWWSLLSSTGATKHTNFIMFLVVKSIVKDASVGQTWPKVWSVLCWSRPTPCRWLLYHPVCLVAVRSRLSGKSLSSQQCCLQLLLSPLQGRQVRRVSSMDKARSSLESLCKPADWLDQRPHCHALFRMPGAGLDVVSPDLMHCKQLGPLGTDQVLLGSVLTWLIKHYLPGTIAQTWLWFGSSSRPGTRTFKVEVNQRLNRSLPTPSKLVQKRGTRANTPLIV